MMKRSDDSTGKEDDCREESSLCCRPNLDQSEPREKEPNHYSCKYFKEAFDPEMDYPPAPVFSSDQVTALTVHQTCRIEKWNGYARDEEERQERAVFAFPSKCGFESCNHQEKPQHQAYE